jgi:lauroyl/myristoyl acyltransferase
MDSAKTGPARNDSVGLSPKDAAFVALMPALFAAAWLLPAAWARKASRIASAVRARILPGTAANEAHNLAPIFPGSPEALAAAFRTDFYTERLQLFAQHSPLPRRIPSTLEGREHLDEALAGGKGALLWVVPTIYASIAGRAAFWQAGFRIAHLSRTDHGFSDTRFGEAFLNPLRTQVERRFLADRVIIEPGRTGDALAELTRRLAANGLVSITVGDRARHTVSAPFLAGRMNVATRPVEMARDSGARLLPVITIARNDGTFMTEIGTTLPTQDSGEAIAALARFMEPRASAYPEQFAGLPFLSAAPSFRPNP